jgi:hypothetical protein
MTLERKTPSNVLRPYDFRYGAFCNSTVEKRTNLRTVRFQLIHSQSISYLFLYSLVHYRVKMVDWGVDDGICRDRQRRSFDTSRQRRLNVCVNKIG